MGGLQQRQITRDSRGKSAQIRAEYAAITYYIQTYRCDRRGRNLAYCMKYNNGPSPEARALLEWAQTEWDRVARKERANNVARQRLNQFIGSYNAQHNALTERVQRYNGRVADYGRRQSADSRVLTFDDMVPKSKP